MRRIGAGLMLMVLVATSVSAQTSLSVAIRRAGRVVGTHETIPATANGLVIGASTRVIGRLGAWASFTTWPEDHQPSGAPGHEDPHGPQTMFPWA